MSTKFTELHCKEVICMSDGRRLGYIADACVEIPTGNIQSIIVVRQVGASFIVVGIAPNIFAFRSVTLIINRFFSFIGFIPFLKFLKSRIFVQFLSHLLFQIHQTLLGKQRHGHLQPMLEFLHLLLAVYRGLLGFLFLGNGHERKEES